MEDWQSIFTAPKDGTPIQARIDGYGSDNIIAWGNGLLDGESRECGGWNYLTGEPPQCWTDGVCWESNENGNRSVQPTHWKPIVSTR